MTTVVLNRRRLLAAGGAVVAAGVSGFLLPARAQGLAPTASMRLPRITTVPFSITGPLIG